MVLSMDFESSLNPCCELFVCDLRLFVTELQTMYRRNQRGKVAVLPSGRSLNWDDGWCRPLCVGWKASGLSEQVSEFNLSSEPGEIRPHSF